MNINLFIKKIVVQLGLPALSLEKYYPRIQEIIMTDTLPTFSQFFPYTYTMTLNLKNLSKEGIGDGWEVYYIRDKYLEENGLDIISVMDVSGSSHFDDWNAPLATFDIESMILEAAATSLKSQLNLSYKGFKFLPPNRLMLRGYDSNEIIYVTCKVPYPTIGSVPESVGVELVKLAKLDVKCWLYPELKMYDSISTADGVIELKIDDWGDAQSQRDDLISDWRNKAYPNSVSKPYNYE